jgi:hypothetical protein
MICARLKQHYFSDRFFEKKNVFVFSQKKSFDTSVAEGDHAFNEYFKRKLFIFILKNKTRRLIFHEL